MLDDPLSRENKRVRASMDRVRRIADTLAQAHTDIMQAASSLPHDQVQQAIKLLYSAAQELSAANEQLGTAGDVVKNMAHTSMAEGGALATRVMATSDEVLAYIIPSDKDGLLRYLLATEVFEDAARDLSDERRRTLTTTLVRLDAELSGRQVAVISPPTTRPEFPVIDDE